MTLDTTRSLPILLPPLAEQRAIAAVLDSIDEAIERTKEAIAATEALRDSLLHELLTRGVPGWHTEWKEVPGLGTIPADWEVVRLGNVCDINRQSWSPDGNDREILYLDLTAVKALGELNTPRLVKASEAPSRARRKVASGDILISTVRPNLRGFARVKEAPQNLMASTGFAVLSPKPDVDASFIYQHVLTHRFANFLENATTGQAYPAVRPDDVAAFPLMLPSLSEQSVIGKALNCFEALISTAKAEVLEAKSVKQSISDNLLAGLLPPSNFFARG